MDRTGNRFAERLLVRDDSPKGGEEQQENEEDTEATCKTAGCEDVVYFGCLCKKHLEEAAEKNKKKRKADKQGGGSSRRARTGAK